MATDASQSATPMMMDDVPLNRFHIKMTGLTLGAHLVDGYAIGSISIALSMITKEGHVNPVWQGLIASSALIGIFIGSLVLGRLSDRVGRRNIFMLNMLIILVAASLQLFVQAGPWIWVQLLVLRLLVGFGLGGDYSVGVSLLAEILPKKQRGVLLGCMNVSWNIGYVASVVVGHAIQANDHTAWRWLLASTAVPAIIIILGRLGTPESPRWLEKVGRHEEAQAVVDKYIRKGALVGEPENDSNASFGTLFTKKYRKKTIFASLIFCCNVVPFFAVYTFLPTILEMMDLQEGFVTEILVNTMLIVGALVGMWATAALTRRQFSIGGFAITSIGLIALTFLPSTVKVPVIIAFVVFSLAINALNNLNSVYPPEVMPTEVRGLGVGFATAMSRIASAIGTFTVPILLAGWSLQGVMAILAVFAVGATVMCYFWAPETKHLSLVEASSASDEPSGAPH